MVCTDDHGGASTVRITPSWMIRFWSLFRGITYKVVISHRGEIDKIAVYRNDEEIGSVTPDHD